MPATKKDEAVASVIKRDWKWGLICIQSEDDSSLMLNAISDKAKEDIALGKTGTKPRDMSLKDQAATSLHLDENGLPCLTRNMMYAAVAAGGVGHPYVGKQTISTQEGKTKLREFMRICGQNYPLLHQGNGKPAEWKPEVHMVSPGKAKGAAAVRPVFGEWQAWIPFRFDASIVKIDLVISLFEKTGVAAGLGGMRKFAYGCFEIKEYQLFDSKEEMQAKLAELLNRNGST